MRPSERMKWIYTFVLLGVTLGWAAFAVWIVRDTMAEPTSVGVLESSGTSVLLGALIGWNALVVQFWFRKKGPPGS